MATELDLPDDVMARIRVVYGGKAQAVLDALCCFRSHNASFATDRVLRCIVSAAEGDESCVTKYIELAKKDWRDVVTAAEYKYPDVRERDLSKPFDM